MKVLVADDSRVMRQIVIRTLRQAGYDWWEITEAPDGVAALDMVVADEPDLVLSDANLSRDPELLDGYIFHARWRVRFPIPPFVFLHGHTHLIRLPGEDSCVVRHVSKPFIPSELMALICAILGTEE